MALSFAQSWMSREQRALALLPDHWRDPAGRAAAVAAAAQRVVSPALLEVLRAHNRPAVSPAVDAHLEALGRPGTTVVITGQQVGLFLGPLYTIYKAATAVAAARALALETGRPCVPLFWLQTEDHDVAEINAATVALPDGSSQTLTLDGVDVNARIPVEHLLLGNAVVPVLDALERALADQPHAGELLTLLRRAYTPQHGWAAAFSVVIRELFAHHGLLVLDPRDARLAALAAPVHARALAECVPLARALNARCDALRAAGFEPQVHVRDDAPLSFFSPDAVDGARYRLTPHADGWQLVGDVQQRVFTTQQLQHALQEQPARFTTSALLRPLLQDTWFPTAAYVGGPAEMTYFSQLGPAYAHVGLPMPLAVPRARFRVLDPRTRANLVELGITVEEACGPMDALQAAVLRRHAGDQVVDLKASLLAPTLAPLEAAVKTLGTLEPAMAREVERTRAAITRSIQKLGTRHARVTAARDQVTQARLERVRAWLMPHGEPQERVHSVCFAAAKFGLRTFVDHVVEHTAPFSGALQDLTP